VEALLINTITILTILCLSHNQPKNFVMILFFNNLATRRCVPADFLSGIHDHSYQIKHSFTLNIGITGQVGAILQQQCLDAIRIAN